MDVEKLAVGVANRVAAMAPGSSSTIARVVGDMPGLDPDELGDALFDLDDEAGNVLAGRGILLDRSAHFAADVGLPCNVPFEVRPIVNRRRGPASIDEVVRVALTADGYFAGHVGMVVERAGAPSFTKTVEGLVYGQDVAQAVKTPLVEREVSALAEAVEGCGVESWYDEYPHGPVVERVLDGEQWVLAVCLADGTCFWSVGDNCYPDGFDVFASLMVKVGFPSFWS